MLIQLYVLRQLLVSIGFSLIGIGLIVLPTIAIQAISRLGAVSLMTVARYLPLVVAELVPYLLPMAFLLGVVATYGRLAAERELVAIRMAGIHPARLALPAVAIAAVLTLFTDFLLAEVTPAWKYLQRTYLREASVEVLRTFAQGRTELEFGGSSLKSEKQYGPVHEGVLLDFVPPDAEPGKEGEELIIAADRATLDIRDDTFFIELEEAYVLTENARLYDQSPSYVLPLSKIFPHQPKDRSKPKYLTNGEMRDELARGRMEPDDRKAFRYEIHRRHALSVTYFVFLLLGIPTGIALRSSTQLGAFTGAVGYAFLYYVLALRLGKVLALAGAVPALAAAWATDALFLVVGLIFFVRALWR